MPPQAESNSQEEVAFPVSLQTISRTGVDITSEAQITSTTQYTADRQRWVVFELKLHDVAGGGNYGARMTRLASGETDAYEFINDATIAVATGTTHVLFQSRRVFVKAGDVVRAYVTGIAGDSSVSISLEVLAAP